MQKFSSFEKYLEHKYYNEMFKAIKNYMWSHKNSLGLYSYVVLDMSYIELDDIHVKSVSFHQGEGNLLEFNASVQADIILKGIGKRDYEADATQVWFCVAFTGYLLGGLNMVTIKGVDLYSKDKFNAEDSLAWSNRGKHSIVWRCCTRVENGPDICDAPTVQETELQEATVKAINQIVQCSDTAIKTLNDNIESALADDNSGEMEILNALMLEKQKELMKLAHAKKDYTALADEIDALRDKKQALLVKRAETEGIKKRIADLVDFLQDAPVELTEYDEGMVRKYIEQIKMYEDKFTVCFKARIDVDVLR